MAMMPFPGTDTPMLPDMPRQAAKLSTPVARNTMAGIRAIQQNKPKLSKTMPMAKANSAGNKAVLATPIPGGMKSGGKVKSASKRADGCAIRGKTRA